MSAAQPREPSRRTKNDRTADSTSPTNSAVSPVRTSRIVARMPPPNPLAMAAGQSTPARADEPLVLVVTISVPCFARTIDRQDGEHDHDGPGDDRHDDRRPSAGPAAAHEDPDGRQQGRRQDDGNGHRTDDQRDGGRGLDREPAQPEHDEEPPAPLGKAVEPCGDLLRARHPVARLLGSFVQDRCRGTPDGRQERCDRDREEEPDDAGQCQAGRQGDEDHRGMEIDRLAEDERRQASALDHVRDADQAQQDDDGDDPAAGIGQEDEGERRQEVADVRDEAGKEDQDSERAGQRHAQDEQEDEVGQAVHGGVDRRPAEVAADLEERVVPGLFERRPAPRACRPEDPRPGLVPVLEQEEEREQRQDADRPERREGTGDG